MISSVCYTQYNTTLYRQTNTGLYRLPPYSLALFFSHFLFPFAICVCIVQVVPLQPSLSLFSLIFSFLLLLIVYVQYTQVVPLQPSLFTHVLFPFAICSFVVQIVPLYPSLFFSSFPSLYSLAFLPRACTAGVK